MRRQPCLSGGALAAATLSVAALPADWAQPPLRRRPEGGLRSGLASHCGIARHALPLRRLDFLPSLRPAADAPLDCGLAPPSGSSTFFFHRAAQVQKGMQQALIRFCVGAKIPAHRRNHQILLISDLLAPRISHHSRCTVRFFQNRYLQSAMILVISAAQQPSHASAASCWGIVQW